VSIQFGGRSLPVRTAPASAPLHVVFVGTCSKPIVVLDPSVQVLVPEERIRPVVVNDLSLYPVDRKKSANGGCHAERVSI